MEVGDPAFTDFISATVDTTSETLTVETLRAAIEKINSQAMEPHYHLFNPRCRTIDGYYGCAGCGAIYEFRNGDPVLSY